MDFYKREIEKKFILKGIDYRKANGMLSVLAEEAYPNTVSFDRYWKAPGVDFVRLRENSREIAVKVTDKGTVVDRIEENVVVEEASFKDAARALTLLFGPPSLTLTKEFSVFRLPVSPAPDTAFEAILCLYKVFGDGQERVFFEVEAESLAIVDYVLDKLDGTFDMVLESRSLYQIFDEDFNR